MPRPQSDQGIEQVAEDYIVTILAQFGLINRPADHTKAEVRRPIPVYSAIWQSIERVTVRTGLHG